MFFSTSRYRNLGTYVVLTNAGIEVKVTRLPLPRASQLLGFHRRIEGQRLDLIANHYLADPTAFFRLCDANGALVPDALAAHDLLGIPPKGG